MITAHPQSRFGARGVLGVEGNPLAHAYPHRIPTGTSWLSTRDGDPAARQLYLAHYSSGARQSDSPLILGPGQKRLFVLPSLDAAIGFRRCWFAGERLVYLGFFANHSAQRSSTLIGQACQLIRREWSERILTLVDPRAVRSPNPGYCFQCAGFTRAGHTTGGLLRLQLRPASE